MSENEREEQRRRKHTYEIVDGACYQLQSSLPPFVICFCCCVRWCMCMLLCCCFFCLLNTQGNYRSSSNNTMKRKIKEKERKSKRRKRVEKEQEEEEGRTRSGVKVCACRRIHCKSWPGKSCMKHEIWTKNDLLSCVRPHLETAAEAERTERGQEEERRIIFPAKHSHIGRNGK